jgi:hypothetical protein
MEEDPIFMVLTEGKSMIYTLGTTNNLIVLTAVQMKLSSDYSWR